MKKSLFIAAFMAAASTASAQLIVNYAFGPAIDDYTPTIVSPALVSSATNVTAVGTAQLFTGNNAGTLIGPGTDSAGTSYTLGTRDDRYFQGQGFAATFDGTNANGLYGASAADYVAFSFTAVDAFILGTLGFDLALGGSSGPRGVTATYNVNGGSSSLLGVAALNVGTASQFGRYSFSFGSIGLSATDVVQVRLHGFSTGTGNSFRMDNISISAVPEPSAYAAMLGLAAVALALLRRRR